MSCPTCEEERFICASCGDPLSICECGVHQDKTPCPDCNDDHEELEEDDDDEEDDEEEDALDDYDESDLEEDDEDE